MRLKDADLFQLLPQYMRSDKTAAGLCYAVGCELKRLIDKIESTNIYGGIDKLSEELLDELAWQFNVIEYLPTADIDVKRRIIKNCLMTHRKRGTPQATEKAVCDVFGKGHIEEWFDYGGEPYHFKAIVENATADSAKVKELIQLTESTKNLRSVLSSVMFYAEKTAKAYIGTAGVGMGKVTYRVEEPDLSALVLAADENGAALADENGHVLFVTG